MAARPQIAAAEWRIAFGPIERLKAAIIVIAFFAVFWHVLDFIPPNYGSLVAAWVNNSDWSHGPIIPLFSAYLVYQNWERVRRSPVRGGWIGVAIMAVGLSAYWFVLLNPLFGIARELAMMLTLLGVIISSCGLPVLRHVWLPYLYLFFAIPIPQGVYFALTNPLRQLAAKVSYAVLSAVPGLTIERGDSIIAYTYKGVDGQMVVADACSGMRSIVTLCALGVAYAFLAERPLWQRIVLLASCIPIAIFCNMIRVIITCLLHIFVGPEYASGNYHTLLGLLVLGLAMCVFLGVGWVLNHLYIEADNEADSAASRPTG